MTQSLLWATYKIIMVVVVVVDIAVRVPVDHTRASQVHSRQ